MEIELDAGSLAILRDGLSDDVAFDWVLIHLGLRGTPPAEFGPPTAAQVGIAFTALERLSIAGLVKVGRVEYIDGGPSGRFVPVRHVEERIEEVRDRVLREIATGTDWPWACWVVNTDAGDEIARRS